ARSASNRWSGCQGFDTAGLSASAARAAVVDGHVAAFCGGASASMIDASIKNNTGPDARAERGVEDIAVAATRAPQCFGKRGGIGIVIDLYRYAINLGDLRSKMKVAPAGKIRRIDHDAGNRI